MLNYKKVFDYLFDEYLVEFDDGLNRIKFIIDVVLNPSEHQEYYEGKLK